jgi:high-affinity iron transporter
MLPTFVITLREGIEVALIIGILAAFLVKEGRREAFSYMWIGIAVAVALCVAAAIALRVVGEQLPHREQEGLETVVGLVAVGMVTYMIVWMRRHARGLKAALESHAGDALRAGSGLALAVMAFLAVLREGMETTVFLVAVFSDRADPVTAGIGAVLGLVAAAAIGVALYRGGTRINLVRFFRVTALVLVAVAGGLVATAVHTAHEAGWFDALQAHAFDVGWLVAPDTVRGSLLTGMLGLRSQPTVGEVGAWLLYSVPLALYVLWPSGWRPALRRQAVGVRLDAPRSSTR